MCPVVQMLENNFRCDDDDESSFGDEYRNGNANGDLLLSKFENPMDVGKVCERKPCHQCSMQGGDAILPL